MEEQTTWRGHGFTLFVFAGIVFLCATFFVLGMLVGRSQAQKYASAGATDTAKTETNATDKVDFTALEDLKKDQPPAPTLIVPEKEEPKSEQRPAEPPRDEAPPAAAPSSVNIQVEALRQRSAAEDLVGVLKKLGFAAFIIAPAVGDKDGFYKVQVGPYVDAPDAESALRKLESAGYNPIIKK